MKQKSALFFMLLPAVLLSAGCQTMIPTKEELQATAGKAGEFGRSTAKTVKEGATEKGRTAQQSIKKSSSAVAKSMEEFTPEQEYYIGRSVAAVILSKYSPYANQQTNDYLNLLGQTLAQASDMPELFRGYRFLVLNSDEINAFATPGGHIFITRGLLRCCNNEDAIAAILAHEIGHVQLRHGIQAIKKARITDALGTIATESVKVLSPVEVSKLTETFSGAISDISNTINNGYSRAFEYDADTVSLTILSRLGYDPNALVEVLMEMEKNLKAGDAGFGKTHPAPQDRIEEAGKKLVQKYAPVQSHKERQDRFVKAVGKI